MLAIPAIRSQMKKLNPESGFWIYKHHNVPNHLIHKFIPSPQKSMATYTATDIQTQVLCNHLNREESAKHSFSTFSCVEVTHKQTAFTELEMIFSQHEIISLKSALIYKSKYSWHLRFKERHSMGCPRYQQSAFLNCKIIHSSNCISDFPHRSNNNYSLNCI